MKMAVQPYMKGDTNKAVVEALGATLADTYILYFKTHSFHWNVEGPNFKSLHDLFMIQYTELWNAIDIIAERIRILGSYAPNNYKELLAPATLQDVGQTPSADNMVEMLADDNLAIVATLKKLLSAAQDVGDEASADLAIQRINIHEKTAWMLRSLLKG